MRFYFADKRFFSSFFTLNNKLCYPAISKLKTRFVIKYPSTPLSKVTDKVTKGLSIDNIDLPNCEMRQGY